MDGGGPLATPVALPAPIQSEPLDPLSPPPAAEGIAIGEPAPIPAAAPGPARTGQLGTTVASLGSPTSPGLWLQTALVSEPGRGRIEYNGQTVEVELRPSGGEPGSGSQISLEAMRALGAPLTGLPELTVYGF
ncbi:D-galactarate dehydratase [Rubellimicrobium rubrum]|uniref:D-galactarate dehydratase n=1 Tax=Rubellimicrobium rubrum TaxID=2585369 RepID=A0A5C4N2X6_9RHOB|nr:D-galactarate dehydratase [Rubellimicrobium rubrum]TNC53047.1 D-galactarate dehydratase [Rubellimicrobium rubrum]